MPRLATRTRILSAGAAATALVAALALAVDPTSDVNPFGSPDGVGESSSAGAPAAPPQAFGVAGVDLAALGYSGPDLSATTLEQLNQPVQGLPTERAADVRDRLGAATPHLHGLHEAKNLLRRAASKQDHHVYAAKVAAAKAEQDRLEAEQRLEEAIREAARPAAPESPAGDGSDSTSTGAALASVDAGHGAAPAEPGDAAADGDAATSAEVDAGTVVAAATKTAAKASTVVADATGGAPSTTTPPDVPDGAGATAGERATPADDGAEGKGREVVDATVTTADGDDEGSEDLVDEAREVERLGIEAAEARAAAARQWHELEARRERRRALREAATLAEVELDRFDDHVRWLETVLSKAQSSMLSAGERLVVEGRQVEEPPIVEVRGFQVHAAIEDSIRQLVDEAAAAGIDLQGRSYRPVSRQIELRRQNCGSTDYDIYEKPSSQCSPPTAKPGRSLHELGLAVDFMNGENSITSRRDPAFRWLAEHAPSYGLYNLPAEPWHWSVTSQ